MVANLFSWLDCIIPSDQSLMVTSFVWNQHNKVTEDLSILPTCSNQNSEYLTIVKVFLDVRVQNGKWFKNNWDVLY